MNSEIWKDILDYEGDYQVSNLGRVKSLKFGKDRILKQYKIGEYFFIDLYKNGKKKPKGVHRIVFETHNNYKIKSDEDVHHTDENKENNNFDNLKVMSESEHHSFHNSGKKFSKEHKNKLSENHSDTIGENNPSHKLTEEQVIQIKLLLSEGILTQKEIADIFKIDQTTISKIKTGKIWSHIRI